MKTNYLQSISEIKPDDCYQTKGSRPIKVFCDDMEHYVCKYFTGSGSAYSLFNEFVAASFLKIWNIQVPDFNFVKIKEDHIKQIEYPAFYFEKNCIGSHFKGEFKEVDKFFIESSLVKKECVKSLYSYLLIGLFDIWFCNEDRHWQNFNLLP